MKIFTCPLSLYTWQIWRQKSRRHLSCGISSRARTFPCTRVKRYIFVLLLKKNKVESRFCYSYSMVGKKIPSIFDDKYGKVLWIIFFAVWCSKITEVKKICLGKVLLVLFVYLLIFFLLTSVISIFLFLKILSSTIRIYSSCYVSVYFTKYINRNMTHNVQASLFFFILACAV